MKTQVKPIFPILMIGKAVVIVVLMVKLDLMMIPKHLILTSDDDQTASITNSNATSASDTVFTWSDRATVLRQRFCFIGSPGRKVAINDITDLLQYFQLFVTNDLLAEIVSENNLQAAVLSAKPIGVKGHSCVNKYYDKSIRLTVKNVLCSIWHFISLQ